MSYSQRLGGLTLGLVGRDVYRELKRGASNYLALGTRRRTPNSLQYAMPRYSYTGRRNTARSASRKRQLNRMKYRKKASTKMPRYASQIGFAPDEGTARKSEPFHVSGKDLPSRVLQSYDATAIHRDLVGTWSLDERLRNKVCISGFKIQGAAYATSTPSNYHTVHVAVIAERGCGATWATSDTDFVPEDGFLRSYDGSTFVTLGTGLSSLELREAQINSDKYIILAHKKITIAPRRTYYNGTGTGSEQVPGAVKPFSMYLTLDRQVRFESPGTDVDLATAGRTAVVVWQDRTAGHPGGTASASNNISMDLRCITYWRSII